jgi:hypothetical protein
VVFQAAALLDVGGTLAQTLAAAATEEEAQCVFIDGKQCPHYACMQRCHRWRTKRWSSKVPDQCSCQ